ncbi:MAG TPA: TylF/MycF/NovP-related O-methyltransferase [Chitinophagaceae bacterium]
MKLSTLRFLKDFLLYTGVLRLFSPLNHGFQFVSNFNRMRSWIAGHKQGLLLNDFYSPRRDYDKRYQLYETVANHYGLFTEPITYLEFGVAAAHSFKWWLKQNQLPQSAFYGFDTFEGLPEDWGRYFRKGDMSASLPDIADPRAGFYKGIFQDTLHPFISQHGETLKARRKVIHMDADLFSSTIFVLSQLHPYLQKGDVIFFDEFNVANHEYQAFRIFTDAFYVKLKPVAAVNNFYQVAFVVE